MSLSIGLKTMTATISKNKNTLLLQSAYAWLPLVDALRNCGDNVDKAKHNLLLLTVSAIV